MAFTKLIKDAVLSVIKKVTDFGVNKIGFNAQSAGTFIVSL